MAHFKALPSDEETLQFKAQLLGALVQLQNLATGVGDLNRRLRVVEKNNEEIFEHIAAAEDEHIAAAEERIAGGPTQTVVGVRTRENLAIGRIARAARAAGSQGISAPEGPRGSGGESPGLYHGPGPVPGRVGGEGGILDRGPAPADRVVHKDSPGPDPVAQRAGERAAGDARHQGQAEGGGGPQGPRGDDGRGSEQHAGEGREEALRQRVRAIAKTVRFLMDRLTDTLEDL